VFFFYKTQIFLEKHRFVKYLIISIQLSLFVWEVQEFINKIRIHIFPSSPNSYFMFFFVNSAQTRTSSFMRSLLRISWRSFFLYVFNVFLSLGSSRSIWWRECLFLHVLLTFLLPPSILSFWHLKPSRKIIGKIKSKFQIQVF